MDETKLGRALGATLFCAAVLTTWSALTMPVPARRPGTALALLWLILLTLHATTYVLGPRVRARHGIRAYAIVQSLFVFAVAVSGTPTPVTVAAFMACTVEMVILAGAFWGTIRITIGAIALFVIASAITSDMYRASTAGTLLAVTGMLAHAIAGLVHRRTRGGDSVAATIVGDATVRAADDRDATGRAADSRGSAVPPTPSSMTLSGRETEVLRELANGARNSDIARTLGISERTVKAHCAAIYRKLGVASRGAAIAVAMKQRLV
jgi:DNA-binding CsgD family transcriptional regulator